MLVPERSAQYGWGMSPTREEQQVGIHYLAAVTALLRRVRRAHPTKGLYEAGEIQWWWGEIARSTDSLGQLFWFDDADRPVAAVIITEWSYGVQLDPIVMPNATPDWVAHVIERGFAHARHSGFDRVQLEVDRDDDVLRGLLASQGFAMIEDGLVESWLAASARPDISQLHGEYRLASRRDTFGRPHHMIKPARPDVEDRLLQTSLYRPDLDLLILDSDDNHAAYGLFWYDPENGTGVVEPMRTEDEHQRRGLARHILTTGIDLLARTGAERIKICFDPDNPAASHLYLSVGFEPVKQTDVFAGRTNAKAP